MTREARKLNMGLDEGLDVRGLKRKTTRSWLLKRITTPGNEELVRDPYTTETIKIAVNGTIVFCLNPDDIPKSLCLCSDPALARRAMILLHETRFVSAAVFASLSPEN